ncbi:MAG: hypothetical protein WBQ25_21875 [Nitrososphaeraceae archaeon]
MSNKLIYAIQPYEVGTKNGKSLAMIIPAGFARKNRIDASTIFILKAEEGKSGNIILHRINDCKDRKLMIPVDESFEASNQQVPSGGH